MVLRDVNGSKTSGNGSSSIVKKIHNMSWLKQATGPKNSERSKTADGATQFDALADMTGDGQVAAGKNRKKRKKKSRSSKPKSDASQNIKIPIKRKDAAGRWNGRRADDRVTKDCQLSIDGAQSGVGKGAWGTDKSTVESLFPEAAETAIEEQTEEEQIELAMVASLETALLEKCAIDPPAEPDVEPVKLSDDEDIWHGVHRNLPSPDAKEETVDSFDANNNSGLNKSRLSSVGTRKPDGKVASCESSRSAANELGSDAERNGAPLPPATGPPYIDKFGRINGCTEKHFFMGRGARKKEEEYREKLQQQHEPFDNGTNQRPRQGVGSHDSHDSHRQKFNQPPGNNSRNGPSVKSVVADLERHFRQSPETPYLQKNCYPVEDDYRNNRQRERFSKHANPDARYKSREPYDPMKKKPYKLTRQSSDRSADERDKKDYEKSDAERDVRTDNDTNRADGEKKINPSTPTSVVTAVQESPEESSMPNGRPYVETKNEAPTKIQSGVSQRSTIESSGESAKPQLRLSDFNSRFKTRQEQATFSTNETSSSHVVPTTVHTAIIDASCQTNGMQFPPASFSVPPPGFVSLKNAGNPSNARSVLPVDSSGVDSAHSSPLESSRTGFSVPPPGFVCLENAGNPSNATSVLPVDSSGVDSAHSSPLESSLTGSAYVVPVELISDSFTEIEQLEAVYARIKMLDPMFHDLLIKKSELVAARRSAETRVSRPLTMPEIRNDQPNDPRTFQDQRTLQSNEVPAKERRQIETLNPNAKQYTPISKQAANSQNQPDPMPYCSMPPSYDPHTVLYYQYVPTSQDIDHQENAGWNDAGAQQFCSTVDPSQHHGHYPNEMSESNSAIGRRSYMVREQNLSYKSVQHPINLPTPNDDYALRCRTSDFDGVSNDPHRQVPYRASHHQRRVAPGQFCATPLIGSYGGQSQPINECVSHFQAQNLRQQYDDFRAHNRNSMTCANPADINYYCGNENQILGFAQQGCMVGKPDSIDQTKRIYVQPIIQPMPFVEKTTVRGKGRGRVRRENKQ